MVSNTKKGFTLIELLVVIAIIGILASVVLASLNTARQRGADAAIQSSLNNARSQAELYYTSQTPNGYAGVCAAADPGISDMIAGAEEAAGDTLDVDCDDAAGAWAAEGLLSDGASYFCVDSTGFGGASTGTVVPDATAVTVCTPAP